MEAGPAIHFPPPADAGEGHGGYWAYLTALIDVDPIVMAEAVGMEVDSYLEHVKKWSEGEGLPYGLKVDLEAKTIESAALD
jgi:hypothetical protein